LSAGDRDRLVPPPGRVAHDVRPRAPRMRAAAYWIERLGLTAHPEGGYYRQTYRPAEAIPAAALPPPLPGPRPLSAALYLLLTRAGFWALHRIRSDELWHFYDGDPLVLSMIDAGGRLTTARLGITAERGELPQAVIPAGIWFGAEVEPPGAFALLGCT